MGLRRDLAQGAESLADTLLSKWSELQGIAATEADAAVPGGDEAAGVSMKALMADEDAALQEAQRKREAAASAGYARHWGQCLRLVGGGRGIG